MYSAAGILLSIATLVEHIEAHYSECGVFFSQTKELALNILMIAIEPTFVSADKNTILFLKIKCFENEIFQKLSNYKIIFSMTEPNFDFEN